MGFRLCTIDTQYIEYLRKDRKLHNVFENKDDANFTRKYIGVVFNIDKYHYYAKKNRLQNRRWKTSY